MNISLNSRSTVYVTLRTGVGGGTKIDRYLDRSQNVPGLGFEVKGRRRRRRWLRGWVSMSRSESKKVRG